MEKGNDAMEPWKMFLAYTIQMCQSSMEPDGLLFLNINSWTDALKAKCGHSKEEPAIITYLSYSPYLCILLRICDIL